jgi:hypothetical protein
MDLTKEVRRRIEELTRLAYERGYREGAQSALAEIEKVSGEDFADQLKETPASLKALAKAVAPVAHRGAGNQEAEGAATESETERRRAQGGDLQRCIQRLMASRGEALRDEILLAARAENPKITSQDVHNGIRTLIRRVEIRVDPK